jgi:hypothetical protein
MCAAVLSFIAKAADNLPLTAPIMAFAADLAISPPTIAELLVLPAPE